VAHALAKGGRKAGKVLVMMLLAKINLGYYQDFMEEITFPRGNLVRLARKREKCSICELGKITACCYPPNQILPLDERSFGWSKRKSFYKNGTRGRAASIRAWRLPAKG
jgi:hypothetical protein